MAADGFRVIWADRSGAGRLTSEQLARPDADAMYASLASLPACRPHGEARVLMVREDDFQASKAARP
jgi:hypothetical protein